MSSSLKFPSVGKSGSIGRRSANKLHWNLFGQGTLKSFSGLLLEMVFDGEKKVRKSKYSLNPDTRYRAETWQKIGRRIEIL